SAGPPIWLPAALHLLESLANPQIIAVPRRPLLLRRVGTLPIASRTRSSVPRRKQRCGTSVLAGRARNLIPSRALGTDGTGRSMRNFEDGPVPRPAVRRAQAHATTSGVNQQP